MVKREQLLAEEQKLRDAFTSFDKDGSGHIDVKELGAAMHAMGHRLSDEEVADLMEAIDTDGNGEIDFSEFTKAFAVQLQNEEVNKEMEELYAVFQSLDCDGSGALSAEELQRALKILGVSMTLADVEFLMLEIDDNGDGEISYSEFCGYVMNYEAEGRH